MKWTAMRVAPIGLVLGAVGCEGGTETGNPPFLAKLSYAAYSSRPETVAIDAAGVPFDVSALWVTIGDLRFVVSGTCGTPHPDARSAPGLGTDNRAVAAPKTANFAMYEGNYCEVDVPFEAAPASLPASAPAELAGNALMIEGVLANGTTISILGDAPSIVLAPSAAGFAMHDSEPNVLVAFDVARWFEGIDFSGAMEQGSVVQVTK